MKKFHTRRILAGVLTLILLLGVLSGCSKKAESAQTPTHTGPLPEIPSVAGLLTVSLHAEVNLAYDKNGLVLFVESYNPASDEVTAQISDSLGKSCAEAVAEVINLALETYPDMEDRTIVLKQVTGSIDPTELFMDDLLEKTRAAAPGYTVFAISASELDELGGIPFKTADAILRAALSLDQDLEFPSAHYYITDVYSFTVPIDGENVEYCVNAFTGTVATAASLGLDFEAESYYPESDVPPTEIEGDDWNYVDGIFYENYSEGF